MDRFIQIGVVCFGGVGSVSCSSTRDYVRAEKCGTVGRDECESEHDLSSLWLHWHVGFEIVHLYSLSGKICIIRLPFYSQLKNQASSTGYYIVFHW